MKTCPQCGKPFAPKRKKQRYCGYSCSGHVNAYKAARLPIEVRFWAKVDKSGECWEWTGALSRGYGNFGLGSRAAGVIHAHRFSWELHFGPVPDGLLVCHKCDNRRCVRPDHIFLGTHKDNTQDAVQKGRMARGDHAAFRKHPEIVRHGEQQVQAKLTAPQVLEIRRREGERRADLAREFGVSTSLIYRIHTRRCWCHLP